LDAAYRDVDRFVVMAEAFHRLRCSKRITVIACRNWNDCRRFAPFLGRQQPVGVTIATGTVIYLTPSINGTWDVGGVLRHEFVARDPQPKPVTPERLALISTTVVFRGRGGSRRGNGRTGSRAKVGHHTGCGLRSEPGTRTCGLPLTQSNKKIGALAIRLGGSSGTTRSNCAVKKPFSGWKPHAYLSRRSVGPTLPRYTEWAFRMQPRYYRNDLRSGRFVPVDRAGAAP
jgi:hypothetical protein